MSNLRTKLPLAPPRYGSAATPPSREFRASWSRRPPEFGPRRPSLLRLSDGSPAARIRYCPRTPRPHGCSRLPPRLRPLQRTTSSPQIPRWWLGVGVQYGPHHPSARARTLTRTPRSSRLNSHSTGRAPTKSLQLAPAPQRTLQTNPLSGLSSSMWIFLPICPALMLAGACRYNAASPLPALTTAVTCRNVCRRG